MTCAISDPEDSSSIPAATSQVQQGKSRCSGEQESQIHMKHVEHIRHLSLTRQQQQGKEMQAAEHAEKLHRRLPRAWSTKPGRHTTQVGNNTESSDTSQISNLSTDLTKDKYLGPCVHTPISPRLPALPEQQAGPTACTSQAMRDHRALQQISAVGNGNCRAAVHGNASTGTALHRASSSPCRPRTPDSSTSSDSKPDANHKPPMRRRRRLRHSSTNSVSASQASAAQVAAKRATTYGEQLYYQSKAAQDAQQQLQSKSLRMGDAHVQYLTWRRRQQLPDTVKVFCMGGYHSAGIRAGLLKRGWFENPDHVSPMFDLKWSISPSDIETSKLWPAQMVNHFNRATCMTTKLGLCRSIRTLPWHEPADYRTFYPRTYDLSDASDRDAWLADMKETAAEALLKHAVAADDGMCSIGKQLRTAGRKGNADLTSLQLALIVSIRRLTAAMSLRCGTPCPKQQSAETGPVKAAVSNQAAEERRLADSVESMDLGSTQWTMLLRHASLHQSAPPYQQPSVSPSWFERPFISSILTPGHGHGTSAGIAATKGRARLSGADALVEDTVDQKDGFGIASSTKADADRCYVASNTEVDADQSCDEGSTRATSKAGSSCSNDGGSEHNRALTAEQQWHATHAVEDSTQDSVLGVGPCTACESSMPHTNFSWLHTITEEVVQQLDSTAALTLARKVLEALGVWFPQTHINGCHNIWVVKPAGKSRGRGIRLFNDPDKLMTYVKGQDALSLEWRWVVSKYIERPLIIHARKFDIRQWVLVTSWSPLTVWFYDTCYLRFAADDYDPVNLDVYIHLSNNSIAKYYTGNKDDDITAQGNMWSVLQFKQWLLDTYGQDGLWEQLIIPAMQHCVVCTTRCCQDAVQARKGSFQLYGFDFLIDDQLNVWLLELCAAVQEDILKVVVDLPGSSSSSSSSTQDTGGWRCIINNVCEAKAPKYTGLNMEVKGSSLLQPTSPKWLPAGSPPLHRPLAAHNQSPAPAAADTNCNTAALQDVASSSRDACDVAASICNDAVASPTKPGQVPISSLQDGASLTAAARKPARLRTLKHQPAADMDAVPSSTRSTGSPFLQHSTGSTGSRDSSGGTYVKRSSSTAALTRSFSSQVLRTDAGITTAPLQSSISSPVPSQNSQAAGAQHGVPPSVQSTPSQERCSKQGVATVRYITADDVARLQIRTGGHPSIALRSSWMPDVKPALGSGPLVASRRHATTQQLQAKSSAGLTASTSMISARSCSPMKCAAHPHDAVLPKNSAAVGKWATSGNTAAAASIRSDAASMVDGCTGHHRSAHLAESDSSMTTGAPTASALLNGHNGAKVAQLARSSKDGTFWSNVVRGLPSARLSASQGLAPLHRSHSMETHATSLPSSFQPAASQSWQGRQNK